jgi:hypothetical protein
MISLFEMQTLYISWLCKEKYRSTGAADYRNNLLLIMDVQEGAAFSVP